MTSHTRSRAARLDVLDIHTWHNGFEWAACLRDYDEGTRVYTGKTQREAVNDLLDSLEQDNGELHE